MTRKQGTTPDISINQGAFLVYMAGIHVPATAINVDFNIMGFPSASISLPADNNLQKLGEEDRVPVAIFFLDKWYSKTNPSGGIKPTWRLLFDGYITGWAYSRSPYNRTMNFSAISATAILNAMSVVYLSGQGNEQIANDSKSRVETTAVGQYTPTQVLQFFKRGAYGTADIKRPMDFIRNLLVGMKIGGPPLTGEYTKIDKKDLDLQNKNSSEVSSADYVDDAGVSLRQPYAKVASASAEFFVKFNHRAKVDKRWIASKIEDVSLRGTKAQNTPIEEKHAADIQSGNTNIQKIEVSDASFTAIMKRLTFDGIRTRFEQKMSTQDTFWNLIQNFYSEVMYNVIQIPTAQFVKVEGTDIEGMDIPLDDQLKNGLDRLGNCMSVPNLAFALSPACNVLTPAMVTDFTYAEDYEQQNTRVLVDATFSDVFDVGDFKFRFGFPADQEQLFQKSNTVKRSSENILIYPEEYFKGPIVSRPKAPPYFLSMEQVSRFQRDNDHKKGTIAATSIVNNQTGQVNTEKDRATKVSIRKWRQELLYSFAKSFYLENKYTYRNGAVNMAFNPYVIPGMTFTMLDNDDFDQFHLTGLVIGVNISMTNASASTSISYTAGRTLKEVYEQVFAENTYGPDVGIADINVETQNIAEIYSTAPIMPIKTLADTLQVDANAAPYYQNLLWASDRVGDTNIRPFIFQHSKFFQSTSGDQLAKVSGNISSQLIAKLKGGVGSINKIFPGTISNIVEDKTHNTITRFDLDLKVLDTEKDNLSDYDLSMQRASRPICSIEEYMKMFNTPGTLNAAQQRVETKEEFGIEYPVTLRIYVVNEDELGDNFIRPYARTESSSSELRRNWPKKLLAYRDRIMDRAILGK